MLPPQHGAPSPTLLLLAGSVTESLALDPYCHTGRLLYARGWNVVSLDLPCHGADHRELEPEGLAGWAARTARGEDIVAVFRARVNDVLAHLVAERLAAPHRFAVAGTSRGGFMAFHAAAGYPGIRAVAGFAPVTDLLALSEFAGQEENPLLPRLALTQAVAALAARAAWITIGNADARVDTARVLAFAHALAAAHRDGNPANEVTLRLLPVPGHCSFPEWHDEAAAWLLRQVAFSI